jgi:hypothetical protein
VQVTLLEQGAKAMSIGSKEIRLLLDSNISDNDKINKLCVMMQNKANSFWPAISFRMLGKKRLGQLKKLGQSSNSIPMQYLVFVLNAMPNIKIYRPPLVRQLQSENAELRRQIELLRNVK